MQHYAAKPREVTGMKLCSLFFCWRRTTRPHAFTRSTTTAATRSIKLGGGHNIPKTGESPYAIFHSCYVTDGDRIG